MKIIPADGVVKKFQVFSNAPKLKDTYGAQPAQWTLIVQFHQGRTRKSELVLSPQNPFDLLKYIHSENASVPEGINPRIFSYKGNSRDHTTAKLGSLESLTFGTSRETS